MKRKLTANYGAAQERAAIKRFVARLRRERLRMYDWQGQSALDRVAAFIDSRTKRLAKRKGGLGMK